MSESIDDTDRGGSVLVAFALCFSAGFATVLGGLVIFSSRLVQLANPVSLAVSLSVSGGVMLFISLAEIFGKSVDAFLRRFVTEAIGPDEAKGHAWLAATICFGLGILLIYVIDRVVVVISRAMIQETEHEAHHVHYCIEGAAHLHAGSDVRTASNESHNAIPFLESQPSEIDVSKLEDNTRRQLVRMGLLSALALGLHNMPEGIATYAGAIQDSSVGFSLAVGIGLHNIPEGIAVAAPIYFATGSRVKAIMWCAISALAEPLGGMIAWLAIGDGMNPLSEGVLFGLVCGIMVCICVKELWPTALRFAGEKAHFVALGTFAGMFIMVTSLILFGYAGV